MNKKILIIDDNEQDRKIMKRLLGKAGFREIIMAENGEEGIKKAEQDKPDLVIIDTLLPGIDGFEVCGKIRKAQGPITPKIIIMTGFVDAVDAVKARQMGADDYTVKTSDYSSLVESVQDCFTLLAAKGALKSSED